MSGSPRAISPSVNAWNAEYLETEYRRYTSDPASVPADMALFFQGFELGGSGGGPTAQGGGGDASSLKFQTGVADLIEAYRSLGHLAACLDPFGREPAPVPALSLEAFGLTHADLDRPVNQGSLPLPEGATLREVVGFLDRTYCRSIGVQMAHLTSSEERQWLQSRFEQIGGRLELDRGEKVHILERLIRSEQFEKFLQNRYPGDKRFSLEGGESVIALMDRVIETASDLGVEEMVIGMAHRGRLNVLNNVMGKSYEQIFTEFEDSWHRESLVSGGGDVKYHRGYSGERVLRTGKTIHLAMASNPSHLESVGPVVQGRCAVKQRMRNDHEYRRVVPMLLHGDAAVIAQGVVAETLNLSQLEGYKVGGTIHAVINNLIGFTTGPQDARSTRYCTDVCLMIECPVFHVNGMDPEAVVTAAQIATEFRQKFRKDVFIDVYCFRKYGHNEQDEASFTQPVLTALVKAQRPVLQIYAEKLLAEGVLQVDDLKRIQDRLDAALEEAQAAAKRKPHDPTIDPGSRRWKGFSGQYSLEPVPTGVPMAVLEEVCAALGRVPEGFNLNPKLKKLLDERAALPKTRQISYADAESIAFGTLLLEGHGLRLSGQDCRRGTFSHRHAVLRDVETEAPYVPLNNMRPIPDLPGDAGKPGADGRVTQGRFSVYDSPLSEAAVLGFDYGYSLGDPSNLVMWEAQFGDFINGAQTMIDQYLASAEVKWERWSGLTLLLPHGYEGAGPEHSSCRVERFLQLCGNENLQVVYPSTAAQCFHMLRRQMKAKYRKPLVVLTPKSMLRIATSTIDELTTGHFQHLIDDTMFADGKKGTGGVTRVLFCTGKLFHELAARRDAVGREDTALVRVEQFYPFDFKLASKILGRYPTSAKKIWVQEEPRNAGAYLFISDLFRTELGIELPYIGRPTSATPATGSKTQSKREQEEILTEAIGAVGKAASKDAKAMTHAAGGAPNGASAAKPVASKAKASR